MRSVVLATGYVPAVVMKKVSSEFSITTSSAAALKSPRSGGYGVVVFSANAVVALSALREDHPASGTLLDASQEERLGACDTGTCRTYAPESLQRTLLPTDYPSMCRLH